MDLFGFRYPTPPPASPSTSPALGVGLASNVLLAGGVHLGLSFALGSGVKDEMILTCLNAAPVIYLSLLLPALAMYGYAAAAWTGWSWWRVPFATLAGATLGLGVNAWAMAQWMAHQGWKVGPTMALGDPRINYLLGLAALSLVGLCIIALSLWPRWSRDAT